MVVLGMDGEASGGGISVTSNLFQAHGGFILLFQAHRRFILGLEVGVGSIFLDRFALVIKNFF